MEQGSPKSLRFDLKNAFGVKIVIITVACIFIVALIVWACISTGRANYMRNEYIDARDALAEKLYGEIYMMCLEYDDVNLVGADVEGDIIPTMLENFTSVKSLNDALFSSFKVLVLDDAKISALTSAFSEYDSAFRGGHSTDSAEEHMTLAVAGARESLAKMYDESAKLISG